MILTLFFFDVVADAHMYTIKAPKAGKEAGIGPLAPQKMSAPFKKKTFRKGGWKRGASRKK